MFRSKCLSRCYFFRTYYIITFQLRLFFVLWNSIYPNVSLIKRRSYVEVTNSCLWPPTKRIPAADHNSTCQIKRWMIRIGVPQRSTWEPDPMFDLNTNSFNFASESSVKSRSVYCSMRTTMKLPNGKENQQKNCPFSSTPFRFVDEMDPTVLLLRYYDKSCVDQSHHNK